MSHWVGNLGNPHQYRNVPYVERAADGRIACLLCGTGWMNPTSRAKHFHGSKHSRNYNRVKGLKDLGDRAFTASLFEKRTAALGLKAWRDSVAAEMYRYVRGSKFANAVAILDKYENLERLSLLELAILKHKVSDGVFFRNLYEIRVQQALDPKFDASNYLKEQRVLCGCNVIVPMVGSFL